MGGDPKKLRALAEEEIAAVLAALPEPLRLRAAPLPVTFETQPSSALQESGIEPDTLGLFIGAPFFDEPHSTLSPHILLFVDNLWDFAEADEIVYRKEVRDTFLHELGHYLGLDEDDLLDRGL